MWTICVSMTMEKEVTAYFTLAIDSTPKWNALDFEGPSGWTKQEQFFFFITPFRIASEGTFLVLQEDLQMTMLRCIESSTSFWVGECLITMNTQSHEAFLGGEWILIRDRRIPKSTSYGMIMSRKTLIITYCKTWSQPVINIKCRRRPLLRVGLFA